jgi:aldehyde:ferredoxin oxidoreductase
MIPGTMGRVLSVDLSSGDIRQEDIADDVYQNHLCGTGLAARLLLDRIPAAADALGPENCLAFAAGLLTGSGSLFAGRWSVAARSPLTGTWGEANCGGKFAPAIKRCGVDGIFFRGASPAPVYLHVKGGQPQIMPAGHLWGMDATAAEEALIREHGRSARVAVIGPAGERLSLIAGVCHDRGRLAARSGLGAVMGSKKLKAVVLDGKAAIPVHDREEIRRLSRSCNRFVRWQPPFLSGKGMAYLGALMRVLPGQTALDGMLYKILLSKWGTASMNQMSVEMGDAPVMNWKGSNVDFGIERSAGVNPDLIRGLEQAKYHCHSCPLGCGGMIRHEGREAHKPEYESITALGALCLNTDLPSILQMNEMLNRAGMDTISAGSTIAFAMECFEAGVLTPADTDGLDLTWGNSQAMIALVDKMIRREGIGDLMADGSRVAAEKIGGAAPAYAVHAGGQELPMHDGRNDPGFNLHYSAEPAPGRHTTGSQMYYEMFQLWKKIPDLPKPAFFYFKGRKFTCDEEKAVMAAACSRFMNVANGAGLCLFGLFLGAARIPVFEWLNAATGWEKSPQDYMAVGERIQTAKQAFNLKHGIDPRRLKVAERAAGIPPLAAGANRGRTTDLEKSMSDYWRQFGWDPQTGAPQGADRAQPSATRNQGSGGET